MSDDLEEWAKDEQESATVDIPTLRKLLMRSSGISLEDIADKFGCTKGTALDACEQLKASGANIHELGGKYTIEKHPAPKPESEIHRLQSDKNGVYRFGLISDTHYGSKYAREDLCERLYDWFEAEGIKSVYHCGNWVDGEASFNKFDLIPEAHGMQAQLDYFVARYPARKGITTFYVAGDDHEGWWVQREGIEIGEALENTAHRAGRKDLVYLGYKEAFITLTHKVSGAKARMLVDHPGGGCFDDSAEILTRARGWVSFADLSLDDEVATMTKDYHEFEWQKPTYITNEEYSGPMVSITSRAIECTVTPDHGFWVRNQRSYKRWLIPKAMPQKGHGRKSLRWYRMSASTLLASYSRQTIAMPTACSSWRGTLTPMVTVPRREPKNPRNGRNAAQMQHVGVQQIQVIAELIAWYVTEGYADDKRVSICQSKRVNPENHARIVALFSAMGLRYCVSGQDEKDISVGSCELSDWLRSECGSGSARKFLPGWLKEQPTEILRIVFDTMIAGDGWINGRSFGYRSISPRLRDDMSEIAQKLGYGVSFHKDTVNIRVVQNEPTVNSRPKLSSYQGRIYCCNVPNELIFVRSNGKAFWSHNSAYAVSYASQKRVEGLQGGEKPAVWCFGHWHKAGYFRPRNVHVILVPCTKDLDPWGRKKGLEYHLGGIVVELHQDAETGAIVRCLPNFELCFDRGYYNQQYSPHGRIEKREAP